MAAPALAQDAPRQFGQSPAGRQFGNQLVPDQTTASVAKPAARVHKPAGKPALAAAKPRTSVRAATAEGKASIPSPPSQEQGSAAPAVAAQGAPTVASAGPSASPPPVPTKVAAAAPASVQSVPPYAIGLLVALGAILAGVFAIRGRRRRTGTDTEGKTPELATVMTAAANPPPTRDRRMTGPALATQTPLAAKPTPDRVMTEPEPAAETSPATKASPPRKSSARNIAQAEPAPTTSPATTVRRKRAVAGSTAPSAPEGAAAPDLAQRAAGKPAARSTPRPAAKPAAAPRKPAAQ